MDIEQLLGIDYGDPLQRLTCELVSADQRMFDELVAMRKARMSQQQCADAMGISQGAVARIEGGERDLHLSTIRRYSAAIGALVRHEVSRFEEAPSPHGIVDDVETHRQAASQKRFITRIAAASEVDGRMGVEIIYQHHDALPEHLEVLGDVDTIDTILGAVHTTSTTSQGSGVHSESVSISMEFSSAKVRTRV